MNLKNINDVLAKISALEGTGDESANVILTKCKNKLDYSMYHIVPKELLGTGYEAPTNFSEKFSKLGDLNLVLSDIKSYFSKALAVNNTQYSPDSPDDYIASEGDGNSSAENRGSLTLTDDPIVIDGTKNNSNPSNIEGNFGDIGDENGNSNNGNDVGGIIEGSFGDTGEGTVNGGASNVIGGIVAGMTSTDIGGTVGFDDGSAGLTGTLVITDSNAVITDENGNTISQVQGQEHTVYEVKYDENGNPVAVRVSEDGKPQQWIAMEQNGSNVGVFIEPGQDGVYEFTEGTLNVYDANGNVIGTINGGEYRVYDTNYDANGNVIAIKISRDGEAEQWVNISENGTSVGTYTPNPILDSQVITLHDNSSKLTLFNKKTAGAGGVIGALAIALGTAMYIKNKNGEKISDVKPGNYDVYEVYQDETGKITDARISGNNETEYWVHF